MKFCTLATGLIAAVTLLGTSGLSAQLGERNQLGVRMGHVHLAVRDVAAHIEFWTTHLGGRVVNNGSLEFIMASSRGSRPGAYSRMARSRRWPAPPSAQCS